MTKAFAMRDVLRVTTGRLLTRPSDDDDGFGNLYEIRAHMTEDQPFTHQLVRFSEECKPWLIRWFPELAKVDAFLPDLDAALAGARLGGFDPVKTEHVVMAWLIRVQVDCGLKEAYDVPHIPRDDHEVKDPYDESVALRGTDEGILII